MTPVVAAIVLVAVTSAAGGPDYFVMTDIFPPVTTTTSSGFSDNVTHSPDPSESGGSIDGHLAHEPSRAGVQESFARPGGILVRPGRPPLHPSG